MPATATAPNAPHLGLERNVKAGATRVDSGMRIGNVEIRPVGGGVGCLLMILASIVLSVLCTVGANLLIR
jgi:hypothetical protein